MTLRKMAISIFNVKNLPKIVIFSPFVETTDNLWQFKKMASFGKFFDIPMTIYGASGLD